MAPEFAQGRRGNLTPEQASTLKAMWIAVFDVFKIEHQKPLRKSPTPPSSPKTTGGTQWSLFGSKPQGNTAPGNEPARWSKDYQEALASYTPEQLHESFWKIPKCEHPDDVLLRFLRARRWDVEAAMMMLVPAIIWMNYEIHVYDDLLARGDSSSADSSDQKAQQDFIDQFRMGKGFLYGLDKDGRPVLYIRARLHYQADQSELTSTRLIVYMVEMMRIMMPPGVDAAVSTLSYQFKQD
nr:cral-trio domain-containing protein c3h8.02 [Quercus suber]